MKSKFVWRVDPEPTGRYRSFQERQWPSALHLNKDGRLLAMVVCKNADNVTVEYRPHLVKSGEHPPLKVRIYSYKDGIIHRKTAMLKASFATLQEAKAATEGFFKKNPEHLPPER